MLHLMLKMMFVGVLLIAFTQDAIAQPVVASIYGRWDGLDGNLTASGEVFDSNDYTAATYMFPIGTNLNVCYDSCVTVRVNDTGSYPGRDMDISAGAADAIGMTSAGVGVVEASVV